MHHASHCASATSSSCSDWQAQKEHALHLQSVQCSAADSAEQNAWQSRMGGSPASSVAAGSSAAAARITRPARQKKRPEMVRMRHGSLVESRVTSSPTCHRRGEEEMGGEEMICEEMKRRGWESREEERG